VRGASIVLRPIVVLATKTQFFQFRQGDELEFRLIRLIS
jgi:hypothetical protein